MIEALASQTSIISLPHHASPFTPFEDLGGRLAECPADEAVSMGLAVTIAAKSSIPSGPPVLRCLQHLAHHMAGTQPQLQVHAYMQRSSFAGSLSLSDRKKPGGGNHEQRGVMYTRYAGWQ